MEIQLLFVGKTKKKYLLDELEAYQKKIRHFIKFSFNSVEERKTNKKTKIKELKEKEYKLIIKQVTSNDIVVILDEKGKLLSSIDFANKIKDYMNTGKKSYFYNRWSLWFIK